FPDHNRRPTDPSQTPMIFAVALNIGQKLRSPVFRICLGVRAIDATAVLMPKTSVNEDRNSVPRQNKIRFPRQIAVMQAITISELAKDAAHGKFWDRVTRSDA